MQGESDGNNARDSKAYEQNLTNFIARVRNDLNSKDLLFVAGKIKWPRSKKWKVVNESMDKVTKKDPNVAVVETSDLTAIGPRNAHFNAPSVLKLGERMGEAFLSKMKI